MSRQRDLKTAYKREAQPMGVYVVRNRVTHVGYIGIATDLDGILNRQRFELKMGGHMNKALVADYKQHGPDAFAFEIVDRLEPKSEPGQDYESELEMLLQLRLEQGLKTEDGTPVRLIPIY
jgi:hypothetical protein